jgi:hypothetical protein
MSMTTKKTEQIIFYDKKEHRWMEETIELKEKTTEQSQDPDKDNDASESRMVY